MSLSSTGGLVRALFVSGLAARTFSSVGPATHVRPKGATPKVDALVIAYRPCAPPFATVHGGPAGSPLTGQPSCPPVPTSPFLTAGTPDNNGVPAQFVGSVRQDVQIAPAPSDILVRADMTDVRCGPPIAPNPALCQPNGAGPPAYKGKTDLVVPIDVTDHCNYGGAVGPCPAPPTAGSVVSPIVLDFPMGCVVPAVPGIGGDCSVNTSWNARYPGIVPPASPPANGSRMNIEVRQVFVTDGSDDGTANPQHRTFAISGLFSP